MTVSVKTIQSVGIDIGTTTTQLVFSILKVMNRASLTHIAHYEFIERSVIYASAVYETPLSADGSIVEQSLLELILQEYKLAGLSRDQIETGAIIITGETSKAKNARTTILKLSEQLGDFVVATAGPHLESIIAGRGSGSAAYSEEHFTRVINVDIGGGTTNYAIFEYGRVVATACLNVGGRLIETDRSGQVEKIHPPALKIVQHLQPAFNLHLSSTPPLDLKKVADLCADLIMECMLGRPSYLARDLLMTDPLEAYVPPGMVIFFSGGVGDLFYQPALSTLNPYQYNDIGPLIGAALQRHPVMHSFSIKKPKQTLRATVIGAGAYSLSLSGSTIWIDDDQLPLKNIPVLFPVVEWQTQRSSLEQSIHEAAEMIDLDLNSDLYAIYLPREMPVTYQAVRFVCDELARFYQHFLLSDVPALVLSYNDVGKVLGMLLEPRIKPKPLAVIDEVDLKEWDYVDIGKSYFGGDIVPLTVKSLAFPP
ncbi:ethanolamine ammonia-lyase reactivating factor EutA [candidate division CSSED10-310 bacterium]|uniref:Ethanolamine ammonia-lyase reactivating factor EutA n=1 Tax=candidate division CSSED10-310 bacterium TaxID=2855610 RepID=A0ABV6YV10_UNCC1